MIFHKAKENGNGDNNRIYYQYNIYNNIKTMQIKMNLINTTEFSVVPYPIKQMHFGHISNGSLKVIDR